MPECPKCHAPLPDGSRFCPTCGAPVGGTTLRTQTSLPMLVVLRLLLRRTGVAIGALLVVTVGFQTLGSPHPLLDLGLHAAVMGLTLFVLMRLGLMAAVSMWLFDWAGGLVRTLDPSAWTAPSMVVSVVVVLGIAGYAAFTALGQRALLDDEALARAAP